MFRTADDPPPTYCDAERSKVGRINEQKTVYGVIGRQYLNNANLQEIHLVFAAF